MASGELRFSFAYSLLSLNCLLYAKYWCSRLSFPHLLKEGISLSRFQKWALLCCQLGVHESKLSPELPNFKKGDFRHVVSLFRKDTSGARLAPSISTLHLPFQKRRDFIRRFASLWNQHFAIVSNCQFLAIYLYSLTSHFPLRFE